MKITRIAVEAEAVAFSVLNEKLSTSCVAIFKTETFFVLVSSLIQPLTKVTLESLSPYADMYIKDVKVEVTNVISDFMDQLPWTKYNKPKE